jgi:hypothetical protein
MTRKKRVRKRFEEANLHKKQNPARRVSIEAGEERKGARQVLDRCEVSAVYPTSEK